MNYITLSSVSVKATEGNFAVIMVYLTVLLLCVGSIVLQVFLSKKESKIAGLVLPILSFSASIVVTIIGILYMFVPQTNTVGELAEMAIGTFISYNFPTIIWLIIYFICHKNNKKKKQLEKMNIQDL